MIPLRDRNPTEKFPLVTVLIIVVCTIVFLGEISLSRSQLNQLIYNFGVVPQNIFSQSFPLSKKIISLFSSMYLHGGFLHLIANMLYLWIFGNNIEERLGSVKFFIFYSLSGLGGALLQSFFSVNPEIPIIGASGAIAGILGGYIILYPKAKILTLVPLFFYITFIELPAFLVIALWFGLQLLSSISSLSAAASNVAYLAHVGGFLTGLILIFIFPKKSRRMRRHIPDDYRHF